MLRDDEFNTDNVGYESNLHRLNAYDDYAATWVPDDRDRIMQRVRILTQLYSMVTPYVESKAESRYGLGDELTKLFDKVRRLRLRTQGDIDEAEDLLFDFKCTLNEQMNLMDLFMEQSVSGIFEEDEEEMEAFEKAREKRLSKKKEDKDVKE